MLKTPTKEQIRRALVREYHAERERICVENWSLPGARRGFCPRGKWRLGADPAAADRDHLREVAANVRDGTRRDPAGMARRDAARHGDRLRAPSGLLLSALKLHRRL